MNKLKRAVTAVGVFVLGSSAAMAADGIGTEAVNAVKAAAQDANPVYVAVIAAAAGFFVVKLIRRAL